MDVLPVLLPLLPPDALPPAAALVAPTWAPLVAAAPLLLSACCPLPSLPWALPPPPLLLTLPPVLPLPLLPTASRP